MEVSLPLDHAPEEQPVEVRDVVHDEDASPLEFPVETESSYPDAEHPF